MLLTKWLLSLQGPGTPPATDGLLYMTGLNSFGQVGNGNFIDQAYFQQIGTRSWAQVVVGSSHTLAIRSDGKLFTWGSNDVGQLGNNDPYRLPLNTPYQVGASSWIQVSAKENTSYGITSDGKLFAWGNAVEGQLGTDSILFPGGAKSWNQVESGAQFTVGIADDYTLWTWGLGSGGMLGSNLATSRSSAVQVGTSSWTMVSTGLSHTIALDILGNLYTWGINSFGRLGDSTQVSRSSPVQIGTSSWSYVASGDTHSLAIDIQGSLFAWGDNTDGAVGDGTNVSRSSPVQVTSISTPEEEIAYAEFKGAVYNSNWSLISSGNGNHFLGTKSNFRLFTWGQGTSGQLGDSQTVGLSSPTPIGNKSWTQVSAGATHSAAIDSLGYLYTWGLNTSGQLGVNTIASTSSPVIIGFANDPGYYSGLFDGNGDYLEVANNAAFNFGTNDFTIEGWFNLVGNSAVDGGGVRTGFLVGPGSLVNTFTWFIGLTGSSSTTGTGIIFQTRNASGAITSLTYTKIFAKDTWYHVAVSKVGTTLALFLDGEKVAENTSWTLPVNSGGAPFRVARRGVSTSFEQYFNGYISNVRVINGTGLYTSSFTPSTTPLTAVTNTVVLTCQNSSFIDNSTNAFTVSFFGNSTPDSFNPFGDVGTTTVWKKVSAGSNFTIGIQDNNKLYTWGVNTVGQLGDSTRVNRSSPTQIGNNSWALVNAGIFHSLATSSTGQLFGWGQGTNGKLGNGVGGLSTFDSPFMITSLVSPEAEISYAAHVGYTESLSWSKVTAGTSFFAAIRSDAKLFTWGINNAGQLGTNDTTNRYLPTKIGDSSWTQVSAGSSHVVGLTTNNQLYAWGLNTSGQLGTSDNVSRSSPTVVYTYSTPADGGSVYFSGAAGFLRADTALDTFTTTTSQFTIEGWFNQRNTSTSYNALIGINTIAGANRILIGTSGFNLLSASINGNNITPLTEFEQGRWNHFALVYTGSSIKFFLNGIFSGELAGVLLTAPSACSFAIGAESDSTDDFGDFIAYAFVSNIRISSGQRYTTNFTTPTSPFVDDADTVFLGLQGNLSDNSSFNNPISVVGVTSMIPTLYSPFATPNTSASWSMVTSSGFNSAGIDANGILHTFGANLFGQLGLGFVGAVSQPIASVNYPVSVNNESWAFVSAGESSTSAIKNDGTLFIWGASAAVADGNSISRSSPVQITSLTSSAEIDAYATYLGVPGYRSWTMVSAGYDFSAGIDITGKLYLWGKNNYGQLGANFTNMFSQQPRSVNNDSWVSVATGNHVLAIKSDGTLWAWGSNPNGQLGTSDTIHRSSPVQIGTDTWLQVAVSTSTAENVAQEMSLAIRSDGALFAWGANTFGKLGDETTINKSSPVQIGTSSWVQVSAGSTHAAAIDTNGRLFLWGFGTTGQLGDATNISKSSPVQVAGTDSWIQVSAGLDKTFGITTLNELYAWGLASGGSLGLNSITNRNTPGRIGLESWIAVSAGSFSHNAYAIRNDNLLFAWGFGSGGRLLNGSTVVRSSPVQVGTSSWHQISGGYVFANALSMDKKLFSGGVGDFGQQGKIILPTSTLILEAVGSINDSWNQVSVNSHGLAIRNDSALWVWGLNTSGQLGINNIISQNLLQRIDNNSWTQVSAGNLYSLGIRDSNLYAWGLNLSAQLGDGTLARRSSPVQIGTSSGWTSIAGGSLASIGIQNNSLYVWGTMINDSNTDVPATVSYVTPFYVSSINDSFTFVSAGTEHSLAIRDDGILFAFGLNSSGQLGLDDRISRSFMTQVGSSSFTMALATADASVVLTNDNRVLTFGNNSLGQLGQGDIVARSSPVQVGSNSWVNIGATRSAIAAIDNTNKLYVWGSGILGEQGTLRKNDINNSPTFVKTLNDSWTVVSGGVETSYAIRDDGALYAWGINSTGQLGANNISPTNVPIKIGASSWQFVKAGGVHALAYGSDKLLYAWGLNNVGQLGDGTLITRSSPVQVSSINNDGFWSVFFDGTGDFIDVPNNISNQLSGSQFTIEMWIYPTTTSGIEDGPRFFNKNGSTTFGYLVYLGTNNRVSFRTDSTNMNTGTINATANTWSHIAVTNDGTTTRIFVNGQLSQSATGVTITSANEQGTLRLGARQFNATQPLTGYLSNVRLVKGTALYTANFTVPTSPLTVVTNTSLLTCNSPLFIDQSTNNLSLTVSGDTIVELDNPFNVSPSVGVSVTNIAAGLSYSLLTDSNHKLYAWGLGTSGQLGTGRVNNQRYITPIGSDSWVGLGTNGTQSLLIRNDKTLFATGTNTNGQLGLTNPSPNAFGTTWLFSRSSPTQVGTDYFANSPVQVTSSSWTQVSAGAGFVLAIRSDNMLFAWGRNNNYQLGTGDTATRSSPVQISTVSWNQISAGVSHALAIDNQSILYGWGSPLNTTLQPVGPSTSWASFSIRDHALAIDNDGKLFVWGANESGQLGLGDTVARSAPVQLGNDTWLSAFVGTSASFLIRNDFKLFVVGLNTTGRLGTNDQTSYSSPVQVGTSSWTQVSSVGDSTMAIDSLNRLYAWGGNAAGTLGLNDAINRSSPVQIGTSSWTQVSVALSHAAAIRVGGGLFTWGLGTDGRLGSGAVLSRSSPVQVGTSSWVQVSCGDAFTAARRSGNTLWTWGLGSSGQLWSGATASRSSPVQVGTAAWNSILAGSAQLYGINAVDNLFVGGLGAGGRLGLGTVANATSPIQLGTLNWSKLPNSRNVDNMLATDYRGFLYSWGVNTSGSLSDGTVVSKSSPVQIGFTIPRKISTLSWSQVSAGFSHSLGITTLNQLYGWGNYAANTFQTYSWRDISSGPHTAAIRSDYKLFMWGLGTSGQLGGSNIISRSSPVQVGTSSWLQVSTGSNFTLAIRAGGTLWSWGAGAAGRLGSGGTANRSSPVQVGASSWTQVRAGTGHGLAIRADGRLFGWGVNTSGEVGSGVASASILSPVQIGSNTWTDISAGNALSMGITTIGALFVWGLGTLGEMGDGTAISKSSPVQIGTSSWIQVSAGSNHAGAITVDKKLFMWGSNNVGQLGDETTVNKSSPVQIGTMDWYDVNAGASFTMAVSDSRMLFGWGLNTTGQVGDGTRENRSSPVQIGTYSWSIIGSTDNTVAMKINGTLWSWGVNTNGQVGQNDRANRSSPTQIGTAVDYIVDGDKAETLNKNSAVTQIGASSWSSVSAGDNYSFVIDLQGVVYGWGASEWQPYSGELTNVGYSAIQISAGQNNAGFIQDE